ncbi:MAG: DUF547 domain-containing protein [Maricaulaceae bacterium]
MPNRWKLIYTAALCTSLIASCAKDTAKVGSDTSAGATIETPDIKADNARKLTEELAEKKRIMEQAEAEALAAKEAQAAKDAQATKEEMDRAKAQVQAAKDAQAEKEEMARAEAEAQAAKNAADAKAAKDAMARVEQEQQAALERQKSLEHQAALEAQDEADARVLRESQISQQPQVEPQINPAPQTVAVDTTPAEKPTIAVNPNAPYNAFLAKYVSPVNGINLVAYDKVTQEDRASLNAYIHTLSAIDIEALPRDKEMATWFNLYNAKTIELILENYPTKSIRKISRPWKKDRLTVNGKAMSLDDIEHGTVRKKYDEPRVHYAFNCASIGCPNVKPSAWEAATLEADLAQAARDFIASERGVSVEGNKIVASSIYKWYKKDFGGSEDGILAHMREYASGSKKAVLDSADNINKYDYDWDLNIR